ncbi:MAG: hypothetical protein ACK5XI_07580, partial [Hyphomonadaceae bacterium]
PEANKQTKFRPQGSRACERRIDRRFATVSGSAAALARKWLKVYGGFQGFGQVGGVFQKGLVIPDGEANRGPPTAKSHGVPALC